MENRKALVKRRKRRAPELPLSPATLALAEWIRRIPRGKVASYGQIASLAGHPRGARQVARLLHSLSDREGLPWHRVINSQGRISLPMEGAGTLQRDLLRKEGVEVEGDGSLELERFRWKPKPGR